ncbi:MAG: lysylphosphatidylglycerol synthase domain-containing protein [Candidatus Aureabacteria bacterium]|nr:lysylphosphatidylglycerol synthase domain-containing protein [Candidatus Auribacterota bacterium]
MTRDVADKKNIWYLAASVCVSIIVFAYLFAIVSPAAIARAIRNARGCGLLAYMCLSLLSTIFRNWRYLLLLRATESGATVGSGQMFLVTLVRNLFADLLPARIGSLVYVAILKARFGVTLARGTSVWAIAFVLDMVVMVSLMALGDQISAIYMEGSWGGVLLLSLLVRVLKYGCLAFLLYAILNPIDPSCYTLRSIGYWPVFVGASLAEFAASTPLSGIAGFGLYEGVWTGSFYLLGYPRELAALSGISAHVITQAFAYSLGGIATIVLMWPILRTMKRH